MPAAKQGAFTALYSALDNEEDTKAAALVDAGATVEVPETASGWLLTPLMLAAWRSAGMVKKLVDAGAMVDATNQVGVALAAPPALSPMCGHQMGTTALMIAAARNELDVVEVLVEAVADLDAADEVGAPSCGGM